MVMVPQELSILSDYMREATIEQFRLENEGKKSISRLGEKPLLTDKF